MTPTRTKAKTKERPLVMDGTVEEALPNATFSVRLETGHTVLAYVSGRLRRNRIRIVPGDRVRVEISPYDLRHGRIAYRLPQADYRQPPTGLGGGRSRVARGWGPEFRDVRP